jgi:hypothetical protein
MMKRSGGDVDEDVREKSTAWYETKQRGIAKARKKKLVKAPFCLIKTAKRKAKKSKKSSIIKEDQLQPKSKYTDRYLSNAPQVQTHLDAGTTLRADAKRRRRANAGVNQMVRAFNLCTMQAQEEEKKETEQPKQPDVKQGRKTAKKRRREIDTALNVIGGKLDVCRLDRVEESGDRQPSVVKKDKRNRGKKTQDEGGKKARGRKCKSGKKQKIKTHYCRIK